MTTAGARITAGALLAAGLMLAGCSGDSGDAGEQGDAATAASVQPLRTITPGTLTVCSDIPYEPFDVMRRGTFTGFDGDLVQEIAAGLDLELRVKRLGFEALQSGVALSSDRCDLVASAMGITEAREQKLDFTDGYFAMELALLVRAGSDIAGLDGVAGRMVGVLQGSRGKTYAEDNAPSEATIVSFPSDAEMVRALFAREVDALVHDLPVALGHADGGAFDVVESYPADGEEYGFGVKEGNTALRDAVNEQLERLREDGTYQAIYDEYFAID